MSENEDSVASQSERENEMAALRVYLLAEVAKVVHMEVANVFSESANLSKFHDVEADSVHQ